MNDDFSFDFLFCVNHSRVSFISRNFAPICILIPNIIARSMFLFDYKWHVLKFQNDTLIHPIIRLRLDKHCLIFTNEIQVLENNMYLTHAPTI